MTVTACIHIQNGQEENEWDYALSNFKPDEIYRVQTSSQPYDCTNNVLRDVPIIQTADELPDGELIILSPQTARHLKPTQSIIDFVHPENATYMFGPNNHHLSEDELGNRIPNHILYLPTDTVDEMFNYMAYTLTMWHRRYG